MIESLQVESVVFEWDRLESLMIQAWATAMSLFLLNLSPVSNSEVPLTQEWTEWKQTFSTYQRT